MDSIEKFHFLGGRHGTPELAQMEADPLLCRGPECPRNPWGGHLKILPNLRVISETTHFSQKSWLKVKAFISESTE